MQLKTPVNSTEVGQKLVHLTVKFIRPFVFGASEKKIPPFFHVLANIISCTSHYGHLMVSRRDFSGVFIVLQP